MYLFFTLQYCIGFAIHQRVSAMGVHVFPLTLLVGMQTSTATMENSVEIP